MEKKYYKYIDIIRVIACIAVLLYHLGFLKGGYLAVCSFFAMSGYLACFSALKKDNFNIGKYYLSRLQKIYLPLIIVVFLTILVLNFFPDITWVTLKPETNSVLLGYNNFWQIGANLDYFARHADSPFMHLWYIAILLQFELVFPIICSIFKKIGQKNKLIPIALTSLLSVGFSIYFCLSKGNITSIYYGTFTRVFSLFIGMLFGMIQAYYKTFGIKKESLSKILFWLEILILIAMFILIDASSVYFKIAMIVTSILTCRLIDYAVNIGEGKVFVFDKVIKYISKISYEVYLVQYPVIFIFQFIELDQSLKIMFSIILIVLISTIINEVLSFKNFNILKTIPLAIVVIPTLYGGYLYLKAEDHTEELKKLEAELAENQKILEEQQKEYQERQERAAKEWEEMMASLADNEEGLKDAIYKINITGIGDSVLLGAQQTLNKMFPNGYIEGQTSSTCYTAMERMKKLGTLGEVIFFNFGSNGDCPEKEKEKVMNYIGSEKDVFWLTVTNDKSVHFNDRIKKFAERYDNLHIIDWEEISKGHKEYFIADGIHLKEVGKNAYAQAIYDAVYQTYLKRYQDKKDELLSEHEKEEKKKITFIGNDLLLNVFSDLQKEYPSSKYELSNYTFESLKNKINELIQNENLYYNVVFGFDNSFRLTKNEYEELIKLCFDKKIYIINIGNVEKIANANIIDFYNELKVHDEYFRIDKVHLTDAGNKALANFIKENLNIEVENESA